MQDANNDFRRSPQRQFEMRGLGLLSFVVQSLFIYNRNTFSNSRARLKNSGKQGFEKGKVFTGSLYKNLPKRRIEMVQVNSVWQESTED